MQSTINKVENPVGYVFSQRGHNILMAMEEVKEILSNEIYWQTLGEVWNRSYAIRKYKQQWKDLLTAERPMRQYFMTPQERKVFNLFIPSITVWQCQDALKNPHDCFSYFLDKDQALVYAQGLKLIEMRVPSTRIFAYVNYQNRNEIIIL